MKPTSDERPSRVPAPAEVPQRLPLAAKRASDERHTSVPSDDPLHGGMTFGRPPSWGEFLVYSFAKNFLRLFSVVYLRMRRRGTRVPRGAVILAPAGHRSNLDTPLVGGVVPRHLRYMAKSSLFKSPFWTSFIVAVGGLPTDRDRLDRRAVRCARDALVRGEALVVFPEGERKSGPRVHPLLDGPIWLSIMTGAPILPIGIGGSERAMPKKALIPRPHRVRLVFGDLIAAPLPAPGRRTVTRPQRAEASERLREVLQDLFDEAQAWAGSPNPPRTTTEDD